MPSAEAVHVAHGAWAVSNPGSLRSILFQGLGVVRGGWGQP